MPKSISERHSWWLCAHCGEESGMMGHRVPRVLYDNALQKELFKICGEDNGSVWMCRKEHKCLTAEEFDRIREAYARKVQE